MRFLTAILATWAAAASGALAQAGQPHDGGIGLQRSVTSMMDGITHFHTFVLVIITAIVLIVLALLIYVIFRFRAKANPEPSKFSHNTLIEVIWTGIPVLILFVIALVSIITGGGSLLHKVLWALIVLLLPVIGLILYFLFGRK